LGRLRLKQKENQAINVSKKKERRMAKEKATTTTKSINQSINQPTTAERTS
jgi:hypothetical protein